MLSSLLIGFFLPCLLLYWFSLIQWKEYKWYRKKQGGIWYKQFHYGLGIIWWDNQIHPSTQIILIEKEDYI